MTNSISSKSYSIITQNMQQSEENYPLKTLENSNLIIRNSADKRRLPYGVVEAHLHPEAGFVSMFDVNGLSYTRKLVLPTEHKNLDNLANNQSYSIQEQEIENHQKIAIFDDFRLLGGGKNTETDENTKNQHKSKSTSKDKKHASSAKASSSSSRRHTSSEEVPSSKSKKEVTYMTKLQKKKKTERRFIAQIHDLVRASLDPRDHAQEIMKLLQGIDINKICAKMKKGDEESIDLGIQIFLSGIADFFHDSDLSKFICKALTDRANKGNSLAQFYLACLFLNVFEGSIILYEKDEDIPQALDLIEKSAKAGNIFAQSVAGCMSALTNFEQTILNHSSSQGFFTQRQLISDSFQDLKYIAKEYLIFALDNYKFTDTDFQIENNEQIKQSLLMNTNLGEIMKPILEQEELKEDLGQLKLSSKEKSSSTNKGKEKANDNQEELYTRSIEVELQKLRVNDQFRHIQKYPLAEKFYEVAQVSTKNLLISASALDSMSKYPATLAQNAVTTSNDVLSGLTIATGNVLKAINDTLPGAKVIGVGAAAKCLSYAIDFANTRGANQLQLKIKQVMAGASVTDTSNFIDTLSRSITLMYEEQLTQNDLESFIKINYTKIASTAWTHIQNFLSNIKGNKHTIALDYFFEKLVYATTLEIIEKMADILSDIKTYGDKFTNAKMNPVLKLLKEALNKFQKEHHSSNTPIIFDRDLIIWGEKVFSDRTTSDLSMN